MAVTVWEKKKIYTYSSSATNTIYSKCEITSQSRNAATQSFTVKITMWVETTGAGTFYNDKWTCDITVGGKSIKTGLQIKGTTSGNIANNKYNNSASGSVTVSGTTGTLNISVTHKNGTTGSKLGDASGSFAISPLPYVTLASSSKTDTTATLTYSSSTISPSRVAVYQDGTKIKEVTSSPFTMTELSPSTTYKFKGYGYGNGDWGSNANELSVTTYRQTVQISNVTISNLLYNSATVTPTFNNASNVETVRYRLYSSDGSLLGTYTYSTTSPITFTLSEQQSYYFVIDASTKDSGAWSNAYTTPVFTTPADQASAYIKVNGVWQKGKVWIKVNGTWQKAKDFYIKKNDSWQKGVNQ